VDAYATSSLWQDEAGTIPATAHDDPVALWNDTSGSTNGVDHSTASTANRPKLQIVGNRRTILSDGISDILTSVTRDFTGKDVFTACFAIRSLDTNGNTNPVWAAHDLNDGLRVIYAPRTSSLPVRFQTDNNGTDAIDAPSPTYDPPLDMVIIVEGDIPSGTLKLWIDGNLVASETGVSFQSDWQTGVSRLFGEENLSGPFAKVEIARGMEISRGLTASEFTDLLNWGQAGLDGTDVTGVFTPADLFTGSATGVFYDVSDLSSMNTEPDQSGSVPAVGDVVRFIADKSGNGNDAQSTSLSASPVLRQDRNGNYYLEFAGTEDDALVTQSNINVSGNSAREYVGASGPGGPVLTLNIGGDIGERWTVREDNGNMRVEIGGSAYVSGLSSDGVVGARLPGGGTLGDHVLSNGTTDENASGSNIVNTGIGPLYIGRIANSAWGNAEFYGCTFIDKLLTAQQRADARQYYAEKRGVVQEAFTPADVFGATDNGLFNRIHPDNLFTDTNGTINATVGDAVAYIEDLSGNENHRIQATVARRPTLQQDPNGAYKLVYDGVDDFIGVTYSGVISTPISTVNVVRKAPNSKILTETTDTTLLRLNIEIAGDGTLTFYAKAGGPANSSAEDISIPSEIEILILGTVWAQENSLYRINGVQNTGLFDPGSNSETAGYRTAANNANPPIAYTILEEYGGIQIDRELTTEQFEKIEDYFKLEVGIAQ
jgi:hypothetical protein